ncbi:MAG TPA: class E sortase [Acidimicrobiia bacterium]
MRRVLGVVGRVFVTVGLLILLFVAYQLWGTGFVEARAQDDLRREFEADLEAGTPQTSSTSGGADETGTSTSTTTTTTTTVPVPIPPDGEPVAIVRIPKIGLDKVVVEGTTVADLRKGPGHYAGTPLPGQLGNAGIAGHRTTYGAPFHNLDQLIVGDTISVETLAGTFDYVVSEPPFAVKPNQTEVLANETPEAPTLTLTTCNPKYSAAERLVVKAELDLRANQPQPQAPTIPTRPVASIDGGLSGEHSSRVPTVVWGAIVAAVGLLWWLVFHRYRRWTTWIVGVIPFLVVLAIFFFYLERILPSNY